MRIAAAAFLLVLAGCGGSHGARDWDCPSGVSITVRVSQTYQTEGHALFYGCEAEVHIRPGVRQAAVSGLIAHELWHAVGYSAHNPVGCVSAPISSYLATATACPIEVDQVATSGGPHRITVLSPELVQPTIEAAAWWNFHVGREVFVVLDPAP